MNTAAIERLTQNEVPLRSAYAENGLDALNKLGRPALRIIGVLVLAGLGARMVMGLPMPDVAGVLALFSPTIVDLMTRSTEAHAEIKHNAYARNMALFGAAGVR